MNVDQQYSPNISSPHLFLVYYRRDFGNFYLRNVDENKEKYFIFILVEKPHVNITRIMNIAYTRGKDPGFNFRLSF